MLKGYESKDDASPHTITDPKIIEFLSQKINKKCFEEILFPFEGDGQFLWVCDKHKQELMQEKLV